MPYTPLPLPRAKPRGAVPSLGSSDEESEPIARTALHRLQRARPWLKEGPFQRLSDLASQALFTPGSVFSRTPGAKRDVATPAEKGRAQEGDEEDEEDSDEDDEDEGQGRKSHIPENRRAGAGVQKKRTSGLASFAK